MPIKSDARGSDMTPQYVDLAILGGGCAGLSLGQRLSQDPSWCKQTVIIESRTHYTNDRSWCFWETLDTELQKTLTPIIRHHWPQWRFSGINFSTVHTAKGRRYCYIAAEDFYQQAQAVIAKNPFVELRAGQSVSKTESHTRGVLLTLDDGNHLLAGTVIDTRPRNYTHSDEARLWQIFYGVEIHTTAAVFDETTVGLMEQLSGVSSATEFIYTLPFSSTHALIEVTHFSSTLFPPEQLMSRLYQVLEQYGHTANYKILRHEQGCLPMGLQNIKSSTHYHHYAGTAGGAIRPATGYAFIRIQQWASHCALSLSRGKPISAERYSSALVKAMDKVFLNVLHDDPALGATLFKALAERVSGSALVRFMMEEATLKDYWQVIQALPACRFILYSLHLHRLFYTESVEG